MERNHSRRVSQFTFIAIPYFSKLVLESILWWTGKRRVWVRRGFARRSWNGKITKHRRCTNYELNNGRNVTLPRRSRISRSARVFLIPRATSRDIRRPCSSAFTESAPCTASAWRRWAAAEGSLWISFVSRAAAQLLPSLLPSLAGEGWWLLVKKRKGPARLSALYFHFIPSFTPVFSRPSKNNMPPFTDNIMSGYVDTWEEGWETVGRR